MPLQNGIYYQQQRGGLCRLHSLNGYFGKEQISVDDFNKYQQEYDVEYKRKFNFESSCQNFDIVASDQKNVVSFILKKYNIYSRYYALNEIYGKNFQEKIVNILDGEYFFIYNESHIWGCRQRDDKWFRVDSMGGIQPVNINTLSREKNIGFIVPVNIQEEFFRNLEIIKSVLGGNPDKEKIKEFLVQKNKERKIIGELEIPLGICMDILETNLLKNNDSEFAPIQEQVKNYNEFLSQFTKGKYNDIDLILEFLPDTLANLTLLQTK